MKSYLFAFLLFFLLVDQSLSLSNPSSLVRNVFRGGFRAMKRGHKLKDVYDDVASLFSPPPPSPPSPFSPPLPSFSSPSSPPPIPHIPGLNLTKDYLCNYGYLDSCGDRSFDDYLDQETISAIETYQNYFNLQATGDLNNDTIDQMSLLRCAVPDMNFNYVFTDNVSWPKAGNQWFPKGKNLTYGFLPESQIPANMIEVFTYAFTRWAEATGVLNLTETKYDDADIKVGFYTFDDGVDDRVLSDSIIRSKPDSKVTGEIRLAATWYWALPSEKDSLSWEYGVLDLESAAMHQIGHLLGLDHSNDKDSVMYPYILPSQQRKVQLSQSDTDNIHQVYSPNVYSAHTGPSGLLLFTTFSLGFAYLLLFY